MIASFRLSAHTSKSCQATPDSPGTGLALGSTYTLHFKDGTKWGIVIVEASELHK